MSEMEEKQFNWQKKFMLAGFKILTKKSPKFPKGMTPNMKLNLYKSVMDYYVTQENFEYCTQLSQSLNKINNETNSK
tara:strand:- start:70 stop:300 length:231 start_codon:yes stop_codon:yes gene_type:complete